MHTTQKKTKKNEKKKRIMIKTEVISKIKELHEKVCQSIQLYEIKKRVLRENESSMIIINLTMIHQLYSKDNIKNLTATVLSGYITKVEGYISLINQRVEEYNDKQNKIKIIQEKYKHIQIPESDIEIIGFENYSLYDQRCEKLQVEIERPYITIEQIEEEYFELEKIYNHFQDVINDYKSKTVIVEKLKNILYIFILFLYYRKSMNETVDEKKLYNKTKEELENQMKELQESLLQKEEINKLIETQQSTSKEIKDFTSKQNNELIEIISIELYIYYILYK